MAKQTKIEYQDNTDRIEVEHLFNRDTHRFVAGLIMTRLDSIASTSIAPSILTPNIFKTDTGDLCALFAGRTGLVREAVSHVVRTRRVGVMATWWAGARSKKAIFCRHYVYWGFDTLK